MNQAKRPRIRRRQGRYLGTKLKEGLPLRVVLEESLHTLPMEANSLLGFEAQESGCLTNLILLLALVAKVMRDPLLGFLAF